MQRATQTTTTTTRKIEPNEIEFADKSYMHHFYGTRIGQTPTLCIKDKASESAAVRVQTKSITT